MANKREHLGDGGELHQQPLLKANRMTTQAGMPVLDNQNTLRAHVRGPSLMRDVHFHEKISHFDRERIPERVVHARGTGAHGHFVLKKSLKDVTTAKVLTEVDRKVPVFVRLSTVVGGRGSADTVRDVRGFSVKFYTDEGNWDLVGNHLPVFFIQDAMKFPDLVHSVKQEPDRGFPSAASAHDTFWDFMVHMPEATHMLMWLMSDRTLPRSLRMMEGHGVHSYCLINEAGQATFVRYRWLPRLGVQNLLWDEAVKLAGADPDFHRRDLWEAIETGHFPVWDLAVQLFSDEQAASFGFDHLDATKLIPEELVPWQVIGHMELNQNPDNFFAETEQVAFCPSRIVPGMSFSDDPLLQGRLMSYLDAQLHRLGSPNLQQLPVNQPRCPVAHHLRDGRSQHHVPSGQVAYEPNGLDREGPRARTNQTMDMDLTARDTSGPITRERPALFADHCSQARMFWVSQTEVEQRHMVAAFIFELSKVSVPLIRERMVAQLRLVDETLAVRVAKGLGLQGLPETAPLRGSGMETDSITPSKSMQAPVQGTLQGRCVGLLVDEGSDAGLICSMVDQLEGNGATVKFVAPAIGPIVLSDGEQLRPDMQLAGAPSVLFDAVGLLLTPQRGTELGQQAAAQAFAQDAYVHLKAIAVDEGGRKVLKAAGVKTDTFIIEASEVEVFMSAACSRLWAREEPLRPDPLADGLTARTANAA